MKQLHQVLTEVGVPYRLIGGMAVFIHVSERDPLSARLTRDVDAAIARDDLPKVIEAGLKAGLTYRHAAGVDMLVDAEGGGQARSAIYLIFVGEKVRAEYSEPVPASPPARTEEGILIAPVAEITPEIESGLPEGLRARLAEVRAAD